LHVKSSLLKRLEALAEYLEHSPGDLLEVIGLHTFHGEVPFNVAMAFAVERRNH